MIEELTRYSYEFVEPQHVQFHWTAESLPGSPFVTRDEALEALEQRRRDHKPGTRLRLVATTTRKQETAPE